MKNEGNYTSFYINLIILKMSNNNYSSTSITDCSIQQSVIALRTFAWFLVKFSYLPTVRNYKMILIATIRVDEVDI